LSCHHTITFCTTLICQPNNLCTVVLKLFANIIPSFPCKLHQVVLFIFFVLLFVFVCYVVLPSLYFCNVHFCFVNIFVLFKFFLLFVPMGFVDWSSLCFLHVHFHHPLDYRPTGSPSRSSFTLTNDMPLTICQGKFFEQNNAKLSREWTHKQRRSQPLKSA
jgi:hypothetical protein